MAHVKKKTKTPKIAGWAYYLVYDNGLDTSNVCGPFASEREAIEDAKEVIANNFYDEDAVNICLLSLDRVLTMAITVQEVEVKQYENKIVLNEVSN